MASAISATLTVFSILLFIVSMTLCIWLGYKRGWFNSALRLGFSIVSALLAFLSARLLAPPLGGLLVSILLKSYLPEGATSILMSSDFLDRAAGGLTAPLTFCLLYLMVDKALLFVYFALKDKFAKNVKLHNVKNNRIYGAILGGVLALTITVTGVMPFGGYLGFAGNILNKLNETRIAVELPAELTSTVDELSSSAVVKVDYAVSGWLFRSLAVDTCSALDESTPLLAVIDAMRDTKNPNAIADALQNIPVNTVARFNSVAKLLLYQFIPKDQKFLHSIADLYLDSISDLTSLSEEEYNIEMSALSKLITLAHNPQSSTPKVAIEAAMSSKILTNLVIEVGSEYKDELAEATKTMTKKEKKELEKSINSFAKDTATAKAYKSILGLS